MIVRCSAALALLVSVAPTQQELITEKNVRETVTWLAHDDRRGRDTGSAELEAAADWIAARFEKAGLGQVRDGAWFHEFTMPALRIDSDAVSLKLVRRVGKQEPTEFELKAGADVRQWLPSDGLEGEEVCTVALADDPVLQRLLQARSARRPIVLELAEDHAFWKQAKGVHTVVARRRNAARPVLLVREGILPRPPEDGQEVEWTAAWSVAQPERVELPQRNVVALLPAAADSDKRDEYVVVSAHYDHVGVGRAQDGDTIYNGADDNATGTTAVVLLAEAFAKAGPQRRNVLFVCFAAEERGLVGSREFCERPPVPLDKVVANLNIEMIGRPEEGNVGKAWITGAGYSDFAPIVGAALERAGVGLVDFRMANQLFGASDNASFARKGIVAHSLSAGSLHDDYHKPGDEVAKLDIAHMTRIVRGLYEATAELASRDQPPAWTKEGEERLKGGRRR